LRGAERILGLKVIGTQAERTLGKADQLVEENVRVLKEKGSEQLRELGALDVDAREQRGDIALHEGGTSLPHHHRELTFQPGLQSCHRLGISGKLARRHLSPPGKARAWFGRRHAHALCIHETPALGKDLALEGGGT
jgi:hypothetical protein